VFNFLIKPNLKSINLGENNNVVHEIPIFLGTSSNAQY